MKGLIIAIFFLIASCVGDAQTTNNNQIDNVEEFNIYGSNNKTIIGKAVININNSSKPAILLKDIKQEKQVDGLYLTTISMISGTRGMPLFGLEVIIIFDKPVLNVATSYNGTGMEIREYEMIDNNTKYKYAASQITSGEISFIVSSKEKIMPRVLGIDAIAK